MNKQILLVATDNDIVRQVPITLELAGCKVSVAGCGLQAVKLARDSLPDVIVVDAVLPDMDGETLVDILGRLPSTSALQTILLASRPGKIANGQEEERLRLNSAGLLTQIARVLELCREHGVADLKAECSHAL